MSYFSPYLSSIWEILVHKITLNVQALSLFHIDIYCFQPEYFAGADLLSIPLFTSCPQWPVFLKPKYGQASLGPCRLGSRSEASMP